MTPQLSDGARYIIDHRTQGISDPQIRAHFTTYGWTDAHLDAAFAEADSHQPHATQHTKYTVTRSVIDTFAAIANNWRAFFATLAISYVIAIIGFVLIVLLMPGDDNSTLNFRTIMSIIIIVLVLVGWYAVSTAFLMATTAKALRDGLQGKRSSIRTLLRDGLKFMPRTALTNAAGAVITFLPILIFVPIVFAMFAANVDVGGSGGMLLILTVLCLFSFVWLYIASLRLSLVQQVAVFEPELSVRQVLKRSSYLLRTGGQWFIVKGALLLGIIEIPLNRLTDGSHNLPAALTVFLNIIILAFITVGLSALTMLYLNRAAVLGHTQ